MTERERFEAKIAIAATGCWLWTASTDRYGYGQIRVAGKTLRAHRYAYELHVGPIPEGLELDHLCCVRNCVNPAHLEPVTRRENVRRGEAPTGHFARATHCKRGHLLAGDNVYPSSRGHRRCKACTRERNRQAQLSSGQRPEPGLS